MAMQALLLPTHNKDTSVFTSIHNAFIALGFVQTSDTGQLNISSPGAYNTTALFDYGYTVYRFDDAAQSTFPIFFRIDWMNQNTSSTASFQFQLHIGTASDGAGVITAAGGTTVSGYNVLRDSNLINVGVGTSTTASTTLQNVWINSDDSHLTIMYAPYITNVNAAHSWGWFSIDRFRDADGTANTRGFHLFTCTSSTGHVHRIWNSTSTQFYSLNAGSGIAAYIPWGANSTTQDGDNIPVFPVTALSPQVERCLSVVGMNNNDIGIGQTFDVVHLGATRRFMGWGGGKLTGAAILAGATTNGSVALLNE